MKHLVLSLLTGVALLAGCTGAMAATMNITAEFSPSMDNPENNQFVNTTPQSGFCANWPNSCVNGEKSLATGITLSPSKGLTPKDDKRDSAFFKWPSSYRNVTITNVQDGTTHNVKLRVTSFSGRYYANSDSQIYNWGINGAAFSIYPNGGCSSITSGWIIGTKEVAWLWSIPEGNTGCYKITSVDRPVGSANFIHKIGELSIGYSLVSPNPLLLTAGIYTGSLTYSISPGGDIDFGDNFQTSDSELTINFTLTVNHELKLTTTPENQAVSLQPCAHGGVCSKDEGKANWDRWRVTLITPKLTGRSNFSLSSSGSFTVYLQCEQQSGTDCALKSDNHSSQTVPVQTLLTLPDNIVDSFTGSSVSKRRLSVGRDITNNIFATKSFGQNLAGSIDFLIEQKEVDTMLESRPDTYRGAVTVIFDPQIY